MNKQALIKNISYTAKNFDLVNWSATLADLEGNLDAQIIEAKYLIEDIETNDDFRRTE